MGGAPASSSARTSSSRPRAAAVASLSAVGSMLLPSAPLAPCLLPAAPRGTPPPRPAGPARPSPRLLPGRRKRPPDPAPQLPRLFLRSRGSCSRALRAGAQQPTHGEYGPPEGAPRGPLRSPGLGSPGAPAGSAARRSPGRRWGEHPPAPPPPLPPRGAPHPHHGRVSRRVHSVKVNFSPVSFLPPSIAKLRRIPNSQV